jgi:hypothetical protein
MKTWLALLGAPTVVLGNLSALYVFVGPACRWGTSAPLHALTLLSLAFALVATLLAWSRYRQASGAAARAGDGPMPGDAAGTAVGATAAADGARAGRHRFLAGVAIGVGALSVAALVLLSVPTLVLSPCQ